MEIVDTRKPPTFEPTGITKPVSQAIEDGDWLGTFNLWILQTDPLPAIVYQQRAFDKGWEPGKLDISAGGHYTAGESIKDGLREAEEELGKKYDFHELISLGRKINVSFDTQGRERKTIMDIFFVIDNSPVNQYTLQESEVHALCVCPLDQLLKVHTDPQYSFIAQGIDNKKQNLEIIVTQDIFPYNWDNYHYKIARLANQFLNGDKDILY